MRERVRRFVRAAGSVRRAVALVVAVVWSIVMIVVVFSPVKIDANVVAGVNGLASASLTYLFATDARREKDNGT